MSTTGAERPAVPGPANTDVPPTGERRVGPRFLFGYALAYFGALAATLAPVILTLQLKVAQLTAVSPAIALSVVLGIGALAAIVANPVFGRLSDRTTSRWGMRRPWLVGGVLVALVGLLVVAIAPSIAVMTVGWVVAQLGFAANLAVLIALLADHVPVHQRDGVGPARVLPGGGDRRRPRGGDRAVVQQPGDVPGARPADAGRHRRAGPAAERPAARPGRPAPAGLPRATYVAVDLALITDVLPNKELDAAKDMGLVNVSNTLPQTLAPAIAPIFLAIGGSGQNYTALFPVGAAWSVVAGLAILRVRTAL